MSNTGWQDAIKSYRSRIDRLHRHIDACDEIIDSIVFSTVNEVVAACGIERGQVWRHEVNHKLLRVIGWDGTFYIADNDEFVLRISVRVLWVKADLTPRKTGSTKGARFWIPLCHFGFEYETGAVLPHPNMLLVRHVPALKGEGAP